MINNVTSFTNLKKILSGALCSIAVSSLSFTSVGAMEDKEVRILAIEGEGVRAIIPLTVLDNMEEQLNSGLHFADYFDVIEGTTSGFTL